MPLCQYYISSTGYHYREEGFPRRHRWVNPAQGDIILLTKPLRYKYQVKLEIQIWLDVNRLFVGIKEPNTWGTEIIASSLGRGNRIHGFVLFGRPRRTRRRFSHQSYSSFRQWVSEVVSGKIHSSFAIYLEFIRQIIWRRARGKANAARGKRGSKPRAQSMFMYVCMFV